MASIRVTPFSGGGRLDVVRQFFSKEAKRLPGAAGAVHHTLRVLQTTPQTDLKACGCLELLRDGVFELRVERIPLVTKPKDHWVRLFIAYYPTGIECVILLVRVKKTNKIDPEDVTQAIRNLKLYKRQ